MNITIVVEGEALERLQKVVALHNEQRRAVDVAHVDITPEAYWQDWNARWLEGLQEPLLTAEEQKAKVKEVIDRAQAKLGKAINAHKQ